MKQLFICFRAVLVFTFLTGMFYPLMVTFFGWFFMPSQSQGSLVYHQKAVIGSGLIGQAFSNPRYFWSRPSAVKYNAATSGASNLSLTSIDLQKAVAERKNQGLVAEMRFSSGSGLDPHISPEAARAQLQRVTAARNLNPDQRKTLEILVEAQSEDRQLGFLGEPRINVLVLNLSIDEHFGK